MPKLLSSTCCATALCFLTALAGRPAFAQVDFSGNWAPLYHEDHPERLPGPELGDYFGVTEGVLVTNVHEESPIGLLPGDARRTQETRPGGVEIE